MMESKGVNHWVTSPFCFCKDLPWLVLSGLPASPAFLSGGLGWEDWAILAASLIALALFLFLLFLLLCLLCPAGLCCTKHSLCCGGAKDEKKKLGLSAAQGVEMSSFGGSEESNLTAVDLKLPRAWMDASKGDLADDKGDLGLGLGSFVNHKTWSSSKDYTSGGLVNRSANFGNYQHGRSEHSARLRTGIDEDYLDGTAEDSAKLDYYRNQSAATIMSPTNGGKVRDAVQEWQRNSTTETRRLVESRQTRSNTLEEMKDTILEQKNLSFERNKGGREVEMAYSTVQGSSQRESNSSATTSASNMALVKTSASGSGSINAATTSDGNGTPVMQCYTVTTKTTTTTYGDDEGDEETSVVTTTEKKWREGMNEVGNITVAAAASAGELLPAIGAPKQVLNDVSNVRTVKSLTNVEGGASNIVRRYEFQQTSNDTDTLL